MKPLYNISSCFFYKNNKKNCNYVKMRGRDFKLINNYQENVQELEEASN